VRPKRFTPGQLAKVGVTITDEYNLGMMCDECGSAWSPKLRAKGHMPRGWWKCPRGCNG